jgi:Flp pilus assembly protein TadB
LTDTDRIARIETLRQRAIDARDVLLEAEATHAETARRVDEARTAFADADAAVNAALTSPGD